MIFFIEKKRIRILTLLAMLVCFGETIAITAVIKIRKQVSVNAGFVKLKDVAVIQESDEKLRKRLEEIVLVPSPSAGRNIRMRFSSIRSRMIALGFDMTKIEFRGSSSVTVYGSEKNSKNIQLTSGQIRLRENRQRKIVQQAEERTQREVANYLRRVAPELGFVRLEMNLQPGEISKIMMSEVPGWDISGGAAPWDRPQLLKIRYLDENQNIQSFRISIRVMPQPAIVVARYDIPGRQILRREDLELIQVENAKDGMTQLEQVVGKETVNTLRKGKPIRRKNLKKVPLIRRGDTVTVVSQFGGIRVERHMVASDEGGMGDVIVVTTTDRKDRIFAKITGLRTAMVSAPQKKIYDTQVQPAGGLKIQYAPVKKRRRKFRRVPVSRRLSASQAPRLIQPYGAKKLRK